MLLIPRWKIPRRSLYMFHSPLSSNIIQIYIYIYAICSNEMVPPSYTIQPMVLTCRSRSLPCHLRLPRGLRQFQCYSFTCFLRMRWLWFWFLTSILYRYIHTYTCIYTCIYYGLSRVLGAITSGFRFHARWRRLTNLQMMGRQGHTSHALHPCKVSPNIYIYIYVIKTYWKHPVSYLFLI